MLHDDNDCHVSSTGHRPENPGTSPVLTEETVGEIDDCGGDPVDGCHGFQALLKSFFFPAEVFLLEKLYIGVFGHTGQNEKKDSNSDNQ